MAISAKAATVPQATRTATPSATSIGLVHDDMVGSGMVPTHTRWHGVERGWSSVCVRMHVVIPRHTFVQTPVSNVCRWVGRQCPR